MGMEPSNLTRKKGEDFLSSISNAVEVVKFFDSDAGKKIFASMSPILCLVFENKKRNAANGVGFLSFVLRRKSIAGFCC